MHDLCGGIGGRCEDPSHGHLCETAVKVLCPVKEMRDLVSSLVHLVRIRRLVWGRLVFVW